jgi:type I restriction enzyme S subunit
MPRADWKYMSQIPFIIPPKQEQQKIADILTTWDNAINQQTTLIEKKQQLKKGLMQQLLTAKTRFSEFSDDWKIVKLCDIVKINKGKQLNKAGLSKIDKYPVVNGGISPSGYTNKWNVEKDTITISEGGNSCGYVNFITSKFWSGGHCYSVTKINPNTVNKFLFQFLKLKERLIMNLRVGSGLPNIQKKDIDLFKIKLPPTKEQQKIAQVLTLADDEITKLQTELALLKTQKKGLMQQLLTGKIRIKI